MQSKLMEIRRADTQLFSKIGRLSRPITWVGALSFEERCTGSLRKLSESGTRLDEITILEYRTRVIAQSEERKRRAQNYEKICTYSNNLCSKAPVVRQVMPYSFESIRSAVLEDIDRGFAGTTIIDITCLTKIHALALAAGLGRLSVRGRWIAAYASPEGYGDLHRSQERHGWRDVIFACLGDVASMENERHSRGIVIPGHEGDRLLIALSEFEPSGGAILVADSNRLRMRELCEEKNRKALGYLSRLGASDWHSVLVDIDNATDLAQIVQDEVRKARDHSAPIILFPFGPKAMIFVAAMELGRQYENASWFVYPIPAVYDVDYTQGIRTVRLIFHRGLLS